MNLPSTNKHSKNNVNNLPCIFWLFYKGYLCGNKETVNKGNKDGRLDLFAFSKSRLQLMPYCPAIPFGNRKKVYRGFFQFSILTI